MEKVTLAELKELFYSAYDAKENGKYDTAIGVLNIVIPEFQKLGDDFWTGTAYECRALSYLSKDDEGNCRSDYKTAIKHYAKSAQQGNKDALKSLDRIKEMGFEVPSISSGSGGGFGMGGSSSGSSKGKITLPNGDVYEGETRNGVPHGKGKMIYAATGNVYEGDLVNGKQNGKGKYTFTSGGIYVGDFVDNKWHGIGKYTSSDGKVNEGRFENDRFVGK